jgi:hypothetical protein
VDVLCICIACAATRMSGTCQHGGKHSTSLPNCLASPSAGRGCGGVREVRWADGPRPPPAAPPGLSRRFRRAAPAAAKALAEAARAVTATTPSLILPWTPTPPGATCPRVSAGTTTHVPCCLTCLVSLSAPRLP